MESNLIRGEKKGRNNDKPQGGMGNAYGSLHLGHMNAYMKL